MISAFHDELLVLAPEVISASSGNVSQALPRKWSDSSFISISDTSAPAALFASPIAAVKTSYNGVAALAGARVAVGVTFSETMIDWLDNILFELGDLPLDGVGVFRASNELVDSKFGAVVALIGDLAWAVTAC